LRYIDDFLFITDDLMTARRFVQVMKSGFPEYGAFISPSKTLLSFHDHSLASAQVLSGKSMSHPPIELTSGFPFCGFLIDTQSLDISMDHHRMPIGRMSPHDKKLTNSNQPIIRIEVK
jgi:hypothetical protein